MEFPRVLILLATYNGAPWIAEQVEGLLHQSGVRIHVLASDDASTDGTRELLTRIAEEESRLQVLPNSTSSGSAAANFRRLIASAEPDGFTHVAFSDQDDLWQPTKLASACRLLSECHADLYSSAVSSLWSSGRSIDMTQSPRERFADFLFEGAGQGCTFVMNRRLFDKAQAFIRFHDADVRALHYHDWLIYALTRCFGYRWVYDRVPSMLYRQHSQNDTGARSSSSGIVLRLQKINSGWYRHQVVAMIAVCRIANPALSAVSKADSLMTNAKHSLTQRMRWSLFALTSSRRRLRDRLIVFVAALTGRL